MSFAGTSVTAGHDNWFNQSYPLVVESILKDAFNAAGFIKFYYYFIFYFLKKRNKIKSKKSCNGK